MLRLEGHSGGVRSVAWSPSGERLASGSDDRAVVVWDAGSGAQVILFILFPPCCSSSDWLSELCCFVSGPFEQVSRLEGHAGGVTSVAWSPSGEQLASGSADKTVIVRDAASGGQVTHTRPCHLQSCSEWHAELNINVYFSLVVFWIAY